MKQIERDGSVYRFNCVSRIRRTWLRRFLLVLLFIPLVLLNLMLATVSMIIAVPFFVVRGTIKNMAVLMRSMALRWNVCKED